MLPQDWNTLSKQEKSTFLKSAGLPVGLSQLKWSGLTKTERKKIENVSKGKGWHEKPKPTRTHRGIKEVAPRHYEVSIKKEAESAVNVPMQKPAHEEKAQAFDWQKIYDYPNLKHVYLGQHGVFERLDGKDKERFIKTLYEHVAENGSWEKAEEDAREFFKTKGFYYDAKGTVVYPTEQIGSTPIQKKEPLEKRLIGQGADLKGVDIDQIEDYIHPRTKTIIKRYKLRLIDGAFSGKTTYRCPECYRALEIWVAGEGAEHLHLACEMGHATTFDKAIDLRKIGKDKETTKWAKEEYKTRLVEAKEQGFDTIISNYNSGKSLGGEYTKLAVGLEKIFNPDASKKEPPLIFDPKRKSYDPKFEEAERTRVENEQEGDWSIQEAEEYIGLQGVNPITGENFGRDWANVTRESWIASEAHKDEFNELVTEAMLSGTTDEDYDAWKAKFSIDADGTIKKLKDLLSKKTTLMEEIDDYIENTCNIRGTRYPKSDCRRMLIAVSSGWKSAGIMPKKEALDEAKKYRAQGFKVRVEKVI